MGRERLDLSRPKKFSSLRLNGRIARPTPTRQTVLGHTLLPLTNRARGPYWGILARGRSSTDRAKQGPNKKRPRANNIPSTAAMRLELARLVSSLLHGTRVMLVLNLLAFQNKKKKADDRFHGNSPKSWPRSNQSERSDLPCHIINVLTADKGQSAQELRTFGQPEQKLMETKTRVSLYES